jgi:hypothetical protein
VNVTFNSLSRDHKLAPVRRVPCPIESAFNSLSRDHYTASFRGRNANPNSDLSTPSLGITCRDHQGSALLRDQTFNSLSRDHLGSSQEPASRAGDFFQLPLSGSLGSQETTQNPYTFTADTFNSLSRDHRARFWDFPALRGFLPRRPFAQMNPKATIWIYRFDPL